MTDQEVMKNCEDLALRLTYNISNLRERGYKVELKSKRVEVFGCLEVELYTVEAHKLVKLTGDTGES